MYGLKKEQLHILPNKKLIKNSSKRFFYPNNQDNKKIIDNCATKTIRLYV